MGYKLVIAEKPSVAQSIARVIGAVSRKDGYLEGNGYLVSCCIGHLVELAEPQEYDPALKPWNIESLPILPEHWKYRVSFGTRKQYSLLKKLMEREDVDSIVEATDAGREGELIFRLVYLQSGCRKSFERLWISSMEDAAIREGFARLQPSAVYDALYQSALCRERADWMVGINATRLFSCLYGGGTLNIGRVMTPTLALTVEREKEIASFVPVPFYTVTLHLPGFVTGRLLASVADPMKYTKTKVILKAGGETFTAAGRTVTDAGWRQIGQHFGKKKEKEALALPKLTEGTVLPFSKAECREGKTEPPKHYTEDLYCKG